MPNRQYHFLARSEEERNKWVEILTKVWKSGKKCYFSGKSFECDGLFLNIK